MRTFLDLYSFVGLEIHRRPLGPLLPAPGLDGTFCARPLTTSEAAGWLRALLQGTKDVGTFRSHSMKATLLGWCARAGLDKESRAVFGHHCCALNGSEVVYSRQLHTRALRNLNHILRRVRSGLSLEDGAMKEFGVLRTPTPFTPAGAPKTPVPQVVVEQPEEHTPKGERDHEALSQAIEAAVVTEELQSAKEEKLDESMLETAAERLTLFPVELVAAGFVEIESSCGSDSSSTSSESDSSSSIPGGRASAVRYIEDVPPGQDFYKHVKSGTAHCGSLGETVSNCKLNMSGNFNKLERRFHFRHPKCRCFPKDSNRIRNIEQLTGSVDNLIKKFSVLSLCMFSR